MASSDPASPTERSPPQASGQGSAHPHRVARWGSGPTPRAISPAPDVVPIGDDFGYNPIVKPVRVTRHARNRMRQHRIDEELVQLTLQAPDWEEPSIEGRINRWKRIGERFLRVTYKEEAERIVVISAVFKRTRPRPRDQS